MRAREEREEHGRLLVALRNLRLHVGAERSHLLPRRRRGHVAAGISRLVVERDRHLLQRDGAVGELQRARARRSEVAQGGWVGVAVSHAS